MCLSLQLPRSQGAREQGSNYSRIDFNHRSCLANWCHFELAALALRRVVAPWALATRPSRLVDLCMVNEAW